MGYSDLSTKVFLSKPEVFADVCNVCIFGGEGVISASELVQMDTAKFLVVSGEDEIENAFQRQRDVQKQYTAMTDGRANYVMLGIENQQDVHYAMPARIMMYDAIDYQMQIKAITDRHSASKDRSVNFWPDEKIIPCVNIVIYYGAGEWDAAKDITDMMQLEGLNKALRSHVNGYPIYVLSPAMMSDEDIKKFRTDMRMVMMFIKNSRDKKKANELVRSDPGFKDISPEAVDVIRATTNSRFHYEVEEGGKVNMCKALDDMCEDAKAEGREEGREQALREMVKNMHELGMSIDLIAKAARQSVDTITGWLNVGQA